MGHLDPKQPPCRGKPWNSIMALDFIHKVDLILPNEAYQHIQQKVAVEQSSPCYYRVTMALGDILTGDFFTEYIKKGNILMLSEGKTTAGNMFTLRQGVLTMYLERETYERAGLIGKPYGVKGGRGSKPRWIISYDLRDSSMLHGKRGFDRLVYACKNVLNQSTTWLFANVDNSTLNPDPLQKHFPTRFTSSPVISRMEGISSLHTDISPDILADGDRPGLEVEATDLYEWLALIRLNSPRVEIQDRIDPYLSRYSVPAETEEEITVRKLTWQGFLSTTWVRNLLVDVLDSYPSGPWFALSATCFSKSLVGSSDEVMFLRPPSAIGKYLLWETKTPE